MSMAEGTPQEGDYHFKLVLEYIQRPEFAGIYDIIGIDSLLPQELDELFDFLTPKLIKQSHGVTADVIQRILTHLELLHDRRISPKVKKLLSDTCTSINSVAVMNLWFGIIIGMTMAGTKDKKGTTKKAPKQKATK
jgi:hypothetical protein